MPHGLEEDAAAHLRFPLRAVAEEDRHLDDREAGADRAVRQLDLERVALRLDRVPLADGATLDDLSFGEDYELLAATPDPLGFTVIGRCEEGSGVEPADLTGWEHFR